MRFAYVLPEPRSYAKWADFEADLACLRQAGYNAVELQIANPADFDEDRVRRSLATVGYEMCAFQTGGSYATCGNFATKAFMDQVMTKLPMKRIGRPSELVGPIVFLCSEAPSMITGLVLPVDGGAHATCPIEWKPE